ncbi:unnamed protein product, partial [Mycena citricolor]
MSTYPKTAESCTHSLSNPVQNRGEGSQRGFLKNCGYESVSSSGHRQAGKRARMSSSIQRLEGRRSDRPSMPHAHRAVGRVPEFCIHVSMVDEEPRVWVERPRKGWGEFF